MKDVKAAITTPIHEWQGPSWNCFYHAVFNRRPVSLITARGHSPSVIKKGIKELVRAGHLPWEPNYLDIIPVSHPKIRGKLIKEGADDISSLKRVAIQKVFARAIRKYGRSEYHRFGFSDDDPKNIKIIKEELTRLKRENPSMGFFIISTVGGSMKKDEVHLDGHIETVSMTDLQQKLFD